MKNLKNILFVILLVFLFVEVLIIFPNRLEQKEEQAPALSAQSDPNSPEQKLQGVQYVEIQQGTRYWELSAKSAEGFRDKGAAWQLRDVRVVFYNKEKVSFVVTGDSGTIDGKSRDLRIKGNVVTKSENGYVFKTPSIFYSAKKRQILSPEKVSMIGPKDEMGEGFNVDGQNMLVVVDESKMTINQDIKGSKKFKDGKNFLINSDRAEFSGKSRQAKFIGNVKMKYANLSLQGPAAIFQYKGATDLISSIQMQGGVKVSDAEKVATSDTVDLDLFKNIFTFRGKPKVVQGEDEISGEEITFLDGGKKVKVDKVRARMEKKD